MSTENKTNANTTDETAAIQPITDDEAANVAGGRIGQEGREITPPTPQPSQINKCPKCGFETYDLKEIVMHYSRCGR